MGENTKIEWADHTFNPWIGCTAVSPGCDHCYAEALAKRHGWAEWGNHPRKRTSEATWKQPLAWERRTAALAEHSLTYTRPFVFCASLADVFDNQVNPGWQRGLFDLIDNTRHLVWLLLTKRPQNIRGQITALGHFPPNIALGCSIVNQDEADRNLPVLLAASAKLDPLFTFVSCEPMLGAIDIGAVIRRLTLAGEPMPNRQRPLDWVIAGGESGPNARPMHPDWVRGLRDQCADAGVAFHFKQWGEYAPAANDDVDLVIARNGAVDRRLPSDMEGGGERPIWCAMKRVGKKAAGRIFEGREHTERPALPPLERAAA